MKNSCRKYDIQIKSFHSNEIDSMKIEIEKRDNLIKFLASILDEIKLKNKLKNTKLELLLKQIRENFISDIQNEDINDFISENNNKLNFLAVDEILNNSKYKNLTYDIFKYLNAKDLINISMTCTSFKEICANRQIWDHIYFKEFDKILFFNDKDMCEVVENAKEKYYRSDINLNLTCEKSDNINLQKKYFELKRLNKNWENDRPVVTTISTTDCVTCIQFDPQSNELISSSVDGSASLFKIYPYRKIVSDEDLYMQHHKQTKICDRITNFHGHSGPIWCIDRCDDIIFTGSYDKTIKIWQARKGNCLSTIFAHMSWVSAIHYDKLCETLVSTSWDSTIKLWNLKTMHNILVLNEINGNFFYCVKSNLSENEVIVGTENKTVDVWNIDRSIKTSTYKAHSERVVTLKHHGNLLFSGSEDKQARVWDKRTANCEILLTGHSKGITQIEYDPFNYRVFTSSIDKTIKLWDIRKNVEIRTLVGHSDSVCSLAYDQTKLISGSRDRSIRIWNFLN